MGCGFENRFRWVDGFVHTLDYVTKSAWDVALVLDGVRLVRIFFFGFQGFYEAFEVGVDGERYVMEPFVIFKFCGFSRVWENLRLRFTF